MIHIKRFIDKISSMESKQNKDVVLPMQEARGLRDEVAKLLSDLYERNLEKDKTEEVLKVEITGGKFK
jgi:polynucleotide 5'-kinase involved in rRNA processing